MIVASTIQALLRLGCYIGLLPSYNSKSRQFSKPKCYWYFVIVLFLLTYIYSLFGKVEMLTYWGNTMKIVLSNARSILMNLLNITAIVSSASNWGLGLFQRIFDDLNSIDRNLLAIHKMEIPKVRYFMQKLIGYNLLIFAIMIADVYHWHLDIGIDQYQFIINDSIQSYYLMIYVLLQLCLLRCLKKRCKIFNFVLDNLTEVVTVATVDKAEDDLSFKIEALVKLQIILGDVCDAFNKLFGWHILLHVFHITINILSAIEIALDKNGSLHTSNVVLIFIWTIYFTAQGVFVATMCEQVSEEGKKTITISYKALNKYSNVPALREKLFILAQQATARCPKFTAAGFFNVDFSMLFTFVNLITTYVIVIIQFS